MPRSRLSSTRRWQRMAKRLSTTGRTPTSVKPLPPLFGYHRHLRVEPPWPGSPASGPPAVRVRPRRRQACRPCPGRGSDPHTLQHHRPDHQLQARERPGTSFHAQVGQAGELESANSGRPGKRPEDQLAQECGTQSILRTRRSPSSRPRLSTAPAQGELRNQHQSPSPARWSFSAWSQPPWRFARYRQSGSRCRNGLAPRSARSEIRAERGRARSPGSPAALEPAKDKSSQPPTSPRLVPPFSPATVTHPGRCSPSDPA